MTRGATSSAAVTVATTGPVVGTRGATRLRREEGRGGGPAGWLPGGGPAGWLPAGGPPGPVPRGGPAGRADPAGPAGARTATVGGSCRGRGTSTGRTST